MKNSMAILFVIKRNKQNKKGLCPLNVRLTYQKKRKEFASGLFVNPEYWNAKGQVVLPKAVEADFLNNSLLQIRQKLNNSFLSLSLSGDIYSVNDIYDRYADKVAKKEDSVVSYFRQFLDKMFISFQKYTTISFQKYTILN